VRDTGIAHALLGIRDKEALLGHPVVGQTWESFIIETLITTAPDGTEAHYYRTSNGTEIDLLLTLPNRELWAIEVKRSSAPKIERGGRYVAQRSDWKYDCNLRVPPSGSRHF
jgi:hypothetical protein